MKILIVLKAQAARAGSVPTFVASIPWDASRVTS